eukprot:jgi/Mesen1/1047/ME000122S00043
MEFYYFPLSMHCHKVRLLLEEKKVNYKVIKVNALKGTNLEPEYMTLNSSGTIPALVDGGNRYFDSKSILLYLDAIDKPLGTQNEDTTRAKEWIERIDAWDYELFSYGNMPIKLASFLTKFKRRISVARMAENPELATAYAAKLSHYQELEEKVQNAEELARTRGELVTILNEAERDLQANGAYLAGQQFSIADASFAALLATVDGSGGAMKKLIKERPHVAGYFDQMRKRPSYKTAVGKYSGSSAQLCIVFPTLITMGLRNLRKTY